MAVLVSLFLIYLTIRWLALEWGVIPDLNAYKTGRTEGLRQYYVPGQSYLLGKKGAAYTSICKDMQEHEFLAGYESGRGIYDETINLLIRSVFFK